MLLDGVIPIHKRAVVRVANDVVSRDFAFIFRSDNVQLISWRAKRIRRSSTNVKFPAVLSLKSQAQIFRGYAGFLNAGVDASGQRMLGRTRFLELVNTFTKGKFKRKSSIN